MEPYKKEEYDNTSLNNISTKIITKSIIDLIDVEDLIKDFKIGSSDCFSGYLSALWKDLIERSDNKFLGLDKITFCEFYEVPGIISERLFSIFDKDGNGYLDLNEFLDGMTTLFSENYERLINFIFKLYDFDKDGFISREDVRTVLSYVPLNENPKNSNKSKYEKEDYRDRVESQEELHALLERCFKNLSHLDLFSFKFVIENISSDMFLFILIFLLSKRPFSRKTLEEFEKHKTKYNLFKITKTPNPKLVETLSKRFMIVSPNINSKFSPSVTIRKSPFWNSRSIAKSGIESSKFNIENSNGKHNDFLNKIGMGSKAQESMNRLLKYSRPVVEKSEMILVESETNVENMSENLKKSTIEGDSMMVDENVMIKHVPIFRKHRNNLQNLEESNTTEPPIYRDYTDLPILPAAKYSDSQHLNNTLFKTNIMSDSVNFNFSSIADDSDEESDEVISEGYMYKLSRNKKMKKRYYRLIHKDIYCYVSKSDHQNKSMHNISGAFCKEGKAMVVNESEYHSFSIINNYKTRVYYVDNLNEYNCWLKNIRKVTGYSNLSDTYDIKEKLGNGKFGLVRLGVHKVTGRKVGIKIMNKHDMSYTDVQMVKTEIEILKICQHPYIIRLFEVYENDEYIYIVMEHCSGGDLFSYLENINFKLSESRAASIVHKLATATYYLHSYGIAHRDLKPENILMTDTGENSEIRLVDFGLSKIIGPNELCTEPFGTLSYVAPEILLEMPYTKSVDLWSIGIITYLLLTGCLPFDDESSERAIARKTIHEPVPFPNYLWKDLSLEAKDFINSLLIKDPSKRMNIKEVLQHPWIQKFNKTLLPEIRRKCKDLIYSTFQIYTSTDELMK